MLKPHIQSRGITEHFPLTYTNLCHTHLIVTQLWVSLIWDIQAFTPLLDTVTIPLLYWNLMVSLQKSTHQLWFVPLLLLAMHDSCTSSLSLSQGHRSAVHVTIICSPLSNYSVQLMWTETFLNHKPCRTSEVGVSSNIASALNRRLAIEIIIPNLPLLLKVSMPL